MRQPLSPPPKPERPKDMCYDKSTFKKYYTNSIRKNLTVDSLAQMIYDATRAKDLLLQSTELKMFGQVLTEAEQTSVFEIVKKLQDRIAAMNDLQKTFLHE